MSYLNERRVKKIYITDGSSILANNDFFYGPYNTLADCVNYINKFCDNLGVNVPLGITVAIYTNINKNSITEYYNNSCDDSGFCTINDFVEKIQKPVSNESCWYEKA